MDEFDISTPITIIKKDEKKDKMYNFTKHLEMNLDNLNKKIDTVIETNNQDTHIIIKDETPQKNNNLLLLIYVVLFFLLNNEFIINLLNMLIKSNEINDYIILTINLVIRTLLFGLIIYTLKNYN